MHAYRRPLLLGKNSTEKKAENKWGRHDFKTRYMPF
jgi:hypothetical protein